MIDFFSGSLKPSNLREKFENLAKQGEEESKKRAAEEKEKRRLRESQEEKEAKEREEKRLAQLRTEEHKVKKDMNSVERSDVSVSKMEDSLNTKTNVFPTNLQKKETYLKEERMEGKENLTELIGDNCNEVHIFNVLVLRLVGNCNGQCMILQNIGCCFVHLQIIFTFITFLLC